MKPTQCKCGLYVAPQLRRCPRCSEPAKHASRAEAADEAAEAAREAQERLDRNVKVLDGHKLRWVIPEAVHQHVRRRWQHLRKRRGMASNAEMRLIKRDAKKPREGRWSWDYGPRNTLITVSPKSNRYVRARANERADLIIDYGTKDRSGWSHGVGRLLVRLKRFERSHIAKALKQDAQEHTARAKAKKAKRKAKLAKRQTA